MVGELILNHSTANYAVFGNPVKHSKSPQIHKLFAKQAEISLEYKAIEVPVDKLTSYIKSFFSQGGRGLNITVPFKEDVCSLCTTLTQRAEASGSVNTILFNGETDIHGDTTDGQGFLNDLIDNHGIQLKNKSILILGAGGTIRSILEGLSDQMTKEIVLVNRTVSRAKSLERKFENKLHIKAYSYSEFSDRAFDIIINGTNIGHTSDSDAIAIASVSLV